MRAKGTDPHVLALHRAPISRIRSMTFRAAATTDLAALSARAVAAGATIALPIGDWGEHGAGRGFALRDRAGRAIRIVQDDHPAVPLPFDADRAERLAHVNFNSDDVMRDVAWFEAALGFAMTDHHTIGWGLGRLGPGDNVFTYFVDPHGFVIEHTAEVLQVDAAYRVGGPDDWTWPPGRVDQRGLCPPKDIALQGGTARHSLCLRGLNHGRPAPSPTTPMISRGWGRRWATCA